MTIPPDADGYSVNQSTGTVHTRYAGDHAGDSQRTRTVSGVESLLGGTRPKVCRTCYPAQIRAPQSPQNGQVRRNAETMPDVRDADHSEAVSDVPEPAEQAEG